MAITAAGSPCLDLPLGSTEDGLRTSSHFCGCAGEEKLSRAMRHATNAAMHDARLLFEQLIMLCSHNSNSNNNYKELIVYTTPAALCRSLTVQTMDKS